MTTFKINGRQISSDQLWQMMEDFENDSLSAEDHTGLLHLLQESRDARTIYLRYHELSALLQIKAAADMESGVMPVISVKQRYAMSYSVMAAAAVIVIAVIVASFIALRKPEIRSMELDATAGSSWAVSSDGSSGTAMDSTVVEGSRVAVSTGTLCLELENGPQMIIQGPAVVRFPKLESPVIEKGWLWVDSRGGKQMEIHTHQGVLRNIGTRFGIRVKNNVSAELHLIDGKVEASWKSGRASKVFGATGEGVVFSAYGIQDTTTLASDPFPGIDELLRSELNYPTALMSQSPSGYWRLGETARTAAKSGRETVTINAAKEDANGIYSKGVKPGVPGMRPTEGFHGFSQENRAVFMSGEGDRSVVYHLDSDGGVSRQEGTVSLWFRRQGDSQRAEVLWFAGEGSARGLDSKDQMNLYLSEDGHVGFYENNRSKPTSLITKVIATDRKWHHVVATWSPESIDLFFDGRKIASEDRPNTGVRPDFKGRNVRIGKVGSVTGPDIYNKLRSFKGSIDEVALWRRSLTPTEVRRQYQVARGEVKGSSRD
ncbi:MAG: LamG domain-containing protein [Verrucomicrobiae bacterium]|nr:LamG domain-containing protein [Verrucomicrobiae bacterium]NNJ85743.1 LamG domain-containing protein [Akkermansiaceae bacterium]